MRNVHFFDRFRTIAVFFAVSPRILLVGTPNQNERWTKVVLCLRILGFKGLCLSLCLRIIFVFVSKDLGI